MPALERRKRPQRRFKDLEGSDSDKRECCFGWVDAGKMVEETITRFGKIDVLVNNAGVTRDGGLMLRMKEEDWHLVIDINLKGVFNCSKAAVKHMAKQRSGGL